MYVHSPEKSISIFCLYLLPASGRPTSLHRDKKEATCMPPHCHTGRPHLSFVGQSSCLLFALRFPLHSFHMSMRIHIARMRYMAAPSSARCALCCFLKRQADMSQEREGVCFGASSCHDGHAEPEDVADVFIGRFGENGVLFDAERVVAHFVNRRNLETAEVARAR